MKFNPRIWSEEILGAYIEDTAFYKATKGVLDTYPALGKLTPMEYYERRTEE